MGQLRTLQAVALYLALIQVATSLFLKRRFAYTNALLHKYHPIDTSLDMLAARYHENSNEVTAIHLDDIPKPVPAPGLAVVRVHSASINPVDGKVMKGLKKGDWAMPFPFTMGYDFAGIVDSLHETDVDNQFGIGDRVFAVNWGTGSHDVSETPIAGAFAEYILIPIAKLSKVPEQLSFDQAASIALVGTTAHESLFACAKVTTGSRILILGGPGAVGQYAIQLAKLRGAYVATTSSTRNMEFVAQFGADWVVNYNEHNWWELPELKGLDAVIDTVGEKGAFAHATQNGVLKADGAFVSIANGEAGVDPAGHPPLHFAARIVFSQSTAVQDELAGLAASGALKVCIHKTFPFTLEGVREMVREVEGGASTGKNILKIVA